MKIRFLIIVSKYINALDKNSDVDFLPHCAILAKKNEVEYSSKDMQYSRSSTCILGPRCTVRTYAQPTLGLHVRE